MIKNAFTLSIGLLLVGLSAAACVNPNTVDRSGAEEDTAIQRRYIERHEDPDAARRAAQIVTSESWRSSAEPVSKDYRLRDAGLTAVYLPYDPRFPDDLYQVGWIRQRTNLDGDVNLREFLSADWSRVAYLQADGTLYRRSGGSYLNAGLHSVEDAAASVFGAQPYFGMDKLRYERTTLMAKDSSWSRENPSDRGLRVEKQDSGAPLRALDAQTYHEIASGLRKDAYYQTQTRRYERLRAQRFSENIDDITQEK